MHYIKYVSSNKLRINSTSIEIHISEYQEDRMTHASAVILEPHIGQCICKEDLSKFGPICTISKALCHMYKEKLSGNSQENPMKNVSSITLRLQMGRHIYMGLYPNLNLKSDCAYIRWIY